ncbi:MAG: riboflavin synthase [Tepidisphaeraceae bacterium]
MFTGIVEKSVRVAGVTDGPHFMRLTLAVRWPDVKLGESVAVNGVCLTVAEIFDNGDLLGFDVIPETLCKTNLGLLNTGELVHVERSLKYGDRLHGHFVQGHVDGAGTLVNQTTGEKEWRLTIEVAPELSKYMIPKGSVCIDGVSLTVASVDGHRFDVALIPTTVSLTTLGERTVGWTFNIEVDILGKTVVNWLEHHGSRTDHGGLVGAVATAMGKL